jgi:hypothetical protein
MPGCFDIERSPRRDRRESGEYDCALRHPVVIEPGLRRRSPENGNIRGGSRRLSAQWPRIWRIQESGDRPPNRKSPPIVGLSASCGGCLSGFRTAWLGREDSNLRMVESKSTALPLGDAPMTCLESGGTIAARIPSGNARSIEGVEPFQQAGTANSPRICTGILPSLYEGFLADGAALPGFEIAPPPGSPAAHPTHRGVAAPRGVERAAVSWEDGSLPSLSERDHGHDLSRADQ